jgi:NADH-quinone oxidoreductase subunit M
MILTLLIVLPLVGGLLAWIAGSGSKSLPRWIALLILVAHLGIVLALWFTIPPRSGWLLEVDVPWIAAFGISYHLGLDGLSLLLVLLTSFLGIIAVAASWKGIQERVGFFHFMLLWVLAAIIGIFLSLDLFLFYFFWEMMLVPLYFLIGIWGHENRVYATIKFFLFTQASSLFMLLSILGLYFINANNSGVYTFDYNILIHAHLVPATAFWLSLGFLIAFIVKLPAVPFHTWLPDAHTEAPTAGSVFLAGLVLKVGAYGLLRFSIPLFPGASQTIAPWMMALGVIGILYGALGAYGQTDIKRLVAYTSVSHMGFVLIGIFAWNQYSLQGAIMVILAHGISTGALFVLAGDLSDLLHTRNMEQMGGLWETIPRFGGASLLFALASLGLPGLGNFIGEFLVLLGAYQANITIAVLATLGFIVSTIYSLWLIQRVFLGPNKHNWKLPDMTARQAIILASLIVVIFWLGLYPQPVLNTARPALETIQQYSAEQQASFLPSQIESTNKP